MTSLLHKATGRSGISPRMGWKPLCFLILALSLSGVSSRSQSLPTTGTSDTTSDPRLDALALARASVEKLFEHSAKMSCTEKVIQSTLAPDGRTAYEEHSLFNYRFQADNSGKSLKFVESRERLQAPFRDPGRTLLITDGFGNMLLILHPAYAADYEFEADGDEVIDGTSTVKFRFKAVPGASSPLMLQVRGQNYSVALDGTVWIEPSSGNVVKLTASSSSDMTELGLQSISSEIQYAPTEFHNPEESYWMPASAVIDVETAHRHWRNIHKFSAYKRLQGATGEKDPAVSQ
jgi:hypothetical protein